MPLTNSTSFATLPIEKFMWLPLLQRDLTGKHVIVTGGSAGLGSWTVQHFASQKQPPASITLTCRNIKNGERVAQEIKRTVPSFKGEIHVESLDLNKFASVKDFAARYNACGQSLDLLIANAGCQTHTFERNADGHETTLQANVLSQPLLALLLLPSLKRASTTPRVVIVSSGMHQYADTNSSYLAPNINYIQELDDESKFNMHRYEDSKLLDVMLARKFAEHLRIIDGTRISWVTACPGFCHSELDRELTGGVYYFMRAFRWLLGRTPDTGARNFIWAALADEKDGLKDGEWVSSCRVLPVRPYLHTPEGQAAEEKVYQQTMELYKQIAPQELRALA